MEAKNNSKIPFKEKLCYGISSGGGNIITQILGTFLTSYLTDSVGIAAAAVGTMMLLARFLDGASDIIMGGIIDRTHTRFGKARPWLLVSAPLILIGLIFTFSIPTGISSGAKIVWMYLSYVFLNCIVFTMYMVSNTSMLPRMTLDGHERQTMSSMNQILNQVGALAVTTFMVALVAKFGWTVTAIIYGIATSVCILIGFLGTKEHLDETVTEGENSKIETVPLKVAVPAMLKNKYFWLLAGIFILILAQAAGPGSMTYYYCNIVQNNLGLLSFISACNIVPTMIINFFVPALTQKFGRGKCLSVSAFLTMIGYIIVGAAGTNLILVYIGTILKSFAIGVVFACAFAMAADVVDYGEWKTGIRSDGLINSCVSFGQKVGLGIGPAIASWIIAAGGYDGLAQVQSQSAVNAITFAFGYFGAILCAIMFILSLFMNMDKYSEQIRADLEKKHMN